jgi:hypothetical protein
VAEILAAHDYTDEVTLAAALLHDLLEDQPQYTPRLSELPQAVVETVEALTEPQYDAEGRDLDKRQRFAGYVAGLEQDTDAARRARVISCADKIDNVSSLVRDPAGHKLLFRLSTRPGEHAEQLRTLRRLYAPVVNEKLLATFDEVSQVLLELIERLIPGHAVAIAAEAHRTQFDKAGVAYIYHPLRLMLRAVTQDQKLVAILHDLLEDTQWTADALRREGIPRRVVRAIECLTRLPGESYEQFIERVASDGLATRVKLLDLEDNSDPSRLAQPTPEHRARIEKYRRAMDRLRPELDLRSLVIVLDSVSRRKLRELAIHAELYGDHVTLAFRVAPAAFSPAWVPGRRNVGDRVELSVVGQLFDRRVQTLLVEIAGTRERPFDGGVLHVTLSTVHDARASESNALIASGNSTVPLLMSLAGTVEWTEA